jgi:signal transduction histidine kinase/ActR/RegA family two-component response regulator
MPGKILATGQPDWTVDVATEWACVRKAAAGRAGLHAWIGVPIRGAAQPIAVMGFFSRESLKPDQDLLASLTAIGAQLGQFIEREQLAEQYRQAQKLEAIGTLAGGIAHDFNNIIAAITGYTELAKMDVSDRPEVVAHLNAVGKASSRAASLVRQILAFSRQQEHERKPMQLRHVVREAMDLLRATVPAMIEFDVSLATDLPPILADASQMHQVIMNLVTNACHAMGNQAGRLGVELESWQVDTELAQLHPGLRAGAYVRLSVSDTGHGMDAATVSRIFEPFFTTKAAGEGTGLGLAVVHGIMQAHEGVVTVYSEPGEGTVFRLYFPALASPASENATEAAPVPKGAGQRILFVDDEPALASLGGKVLERLGYSVQTQTSAALAVELVRAQPSAFDLVVTDLAMPLMTGTDLARELRQVRPDIPILLVTGHSATLTAERVQTMGIHDLLTKPLSVHALGTAVQRALQPQH